MNNKEQNRKFNNFHKTNQSEKNMKISHFFSPFWNSRSKFSINFAVGELTYSKFMSADEFSYGVGKLCNGIIVKNI